MIFKLFQRRKEREPTPTSPWLEEIQKRTKSGAENHYIEMCEDVQNRIENQADDGLNHLCFFDYRESEEKKLVHDLEMFGFNVERNKTFDYGERYLVISW